MSRQGRGHARRAAAVLATAVLALGILTALAVPQALACSCVPTTDQEAFDRAAAVFTGTVVDYRPPEVTESWTSSDPAIWVFDVHEVHKGAVARPRQEVASAVSSASCGLEPPAGGATYRVYAEAGGPEAALTASLCGGTHEVAAQPVPEVEDRVLGEPLAVDRRGGQTGGLGPLGLALVGGGAAAGAAALTGLVWWRRGLR